MTVRNAPGSIHRADDGRAKKRGRTGKSSSASYSETPVPCKLAFHPLANIFPLLEGAEFDRFVADISEHGLLNPITLHEDMILEGRNRYRACQAAGVDPVYVPFTGKDPAAFVLSQNLARRHLGPSERAMVAARMANLKWGQCADRVEGQICLSAAAKLVGVSERSVKSARAVLEHGTADLQEAVDRGRVAVHEAEKAARLDVGAQADFLAAMAAGKTFVHWRIDYGRRARATELAATTRALPDGEKRWPVILADFPWNYDNLIPVESRIHPSEHYPTMTDAEICAFPMAAVATKHCVLFLWATVSHLPIAIDAIRAWGFEYKSCFAWDKEHSGLGYWALGQHELLLVATKGNPPTAPTDSLSSSVIRERRREHSRKPEASYAIIERMYPDLPKLELFARQARPGWDAWGNETDKFKGAA
jgi:N6-adenosine-specific RNA methylase IME4/ParB-like chromosome segregation protein Spo0J